MAHSSFSQPLPANLRPLMASGYSADSKDAKKFEVIGLAPAGALSSTGEDMGKFMIAHMANGGPLLDPETAKEMHGVGNQPFKDLPAMALGFYHEDRNGLDIVGHGGDTDYFHSDLHLILPKNVGLYISMNSAGRDAAAHVLRQQLLEEFTDRYYPHQARPLPTAGNAADMGKAMAGHYISSRAGGFNWLRMTALLGQAKVSVDKDNQLLVSSITDPSGQPVRWRAIGQWLWQDVASANRLEAVPGQDGAIRMFSITPYAPIIEFVPAPPSLNSGWIFPVTALALIIVAVAALAWPIVPLVRRRYGAGAAYVGRDLQLRRITRAAAWLALVLLGGWLFVLSLVDKDLSILSDRLDFWLRLLQLGLVLLAFGAAAATWNSVRAFQTRDYGWSGKSWLAAIALALLFLVWLGLNMGLLTPSLEY